MYISRHLEASVETYRQIFPVVGILGPRQCGKSTLVRHLRSQWEKCIYLDLQNPVDLNKLNDPFLFFESHMDAIICIDEIQLKPALFSILRSVVDQNRQKGRFVLLGSASRNMIQQGSETLAGRIGYLYLSPFAFTELNDTRVQDFWNRGGYPDSVLAENDKFSYIWRENFLRTYVERDIPQFGFQIPALQLRRFLTLCAHSQGQILNLSKLATAMDMSHVTMRKYADLLEQTFILRTLQPYFANVKKRLVKSPKVYVRDSGLLHALLGIKNTEQLFGHPVFGSSWEGLVIEEVLSQIDSPAYFYRTAKGDEIDLVIDINGKIIAIECKASSAPSPSKGLFKAVEDINASHVFIVSPISTDDYQLNETIKVCSLSGLMRALKKLNE